MLVRTYLNGSPNALWRYQPGDRLYPGPDLTFEVEVTDQRTPEQAETIARDMAWTVGNRMASDSAGEGWPSNVRSMSTGDVLVIGETAWAVASIGWTRIETDALQASLDPERWEDGGPDRAPMVDAADWARRFPDRADAVWPKLQKGA